MTDEELIVRLRENVFYGDARLHNLARHNPLHMEAADRIEALVSALREIVALNSPEKAWEATLAKNISTAALKGDQK